MCHFRRCAASAPVEARWVTFATSDEVETLRGGPLCGLKIAAHPWTRHIRTAVSRRRQVGDAERRPGGQARRGGRPSRGCRSDPFRNLTFAMQDCFVWARQSFEMSDVDRFAAKGYKRRCRQCCDRSTAR